MKIASVTFENMEVDTLPLRQKMDFNLDLTGADENYIYFNANLFTDLKTNPFLNETRTTDIDFGYRDNYMITGIFKIPAGYKVDALPKSITMMIPDKSVVFKRMIITFRNLHALRCVCSYPALSIIFTYTLSPILKYCWP